MIAKLIAKFRDWIWYRQSMKAHRLSTSKAFVEQMAAMARIPMEIFGSDEDGWYMHPKMSEEARKALGKCIRDYYRAPYVRGKSIVDFHVETPLDKPL